MTEHVHEAGHGEHGGGAHVAPVSLYFSTFVILMVLLVATVGAAHFNFGSFNIVVAMAIAIVKAVFVIMNFMGVRYQSTLTRIFVVMGFIWLLIMFTIITDYMTRWVHAPGWTP